VSLLAEELVEEWLNRNGFFTIRGVKLGVQEIDLLAIGLAGNKLVRRHIEVSASVRPISYLTALPKDTQKATGRGPANAKRRTSQELEDGVAEWVEKKYHLPRKQQLLQALAPGEWTHELVVHKLKYPEELDLLRARGVVITLIRAMPPDARKNLVITVKAMLRMQQITEQIKATNDRETDSTRPRLLCRDATIYGQHRTDQRLGQGGAGQVRWPVDRALARFRLDLARSLRMGGIRPTNPQDSRPPVHNGTRRVQWPHHQSSMSPIPLYWGPASHETH